MFLCATVNSGQAQGIFHYFTGLFLQDSSSVVKTDRFGVDLYYNSWITSPKDINVRPNSIGFNVYRMYDITFGKSNFGIGLGYGLSSHNVHHNGSFNKILDTLGNTFTQLTPFPDEYEYRKNKISINYFEIPFEFRFRTKRKEKTDGTVSSFFRFYVGFKAGYLVNIHTTLKNKQGKFKYYNYDNLDRFRYGATARIGYGRFSFYGFYALNDLFKDDKSTSLQSFALGLSFSGF